jgi:hypothetical protein
MAEVIVHFKLPLMERLSLCGVKQSIYCSDEQSYGRSDGFCDEVNHVKHLIDIGYDVKVGSIRNRLSFSIFRQILDLSKYIKDGSFDVVMIHQQRAAPVAMMASVLARTPVKMYFSGGLMTPPVGCDNAEQPGRL